VDTVYTVREVGIDALTISAKPDGPTARLALRAGVLLSQSRQQGNDTGAEARLGYTGTRSGPVFYGEGSQGGLLIVAGPSAETAWPIVGKEGISVARIDVQVTVHYDPFDRDDGERWFRQLEAIGRKGRGGCSAGRTGDADGGVTVYIGKRASPYFRRVYNKYAQSGKEAYLGCWRWEVECKDEGADAVCACLLGAADRNAAIADIVHREFSLHGLRPGWLARGEYVPELPSRVASDSDRRLDWLRKQVAPTVNLLRLAGKEKEVLECLALTRDPVAVPTVNHSPLLGGHYVGPIDRTPGES
jgi:hypothetical protein